MDMSRLGTGDKIAAAAGAVLLVVLFLPWYGVDAQFGAVSVSESVSAWGAMSFIDLLLFLIAAIAIAVPLARASGSLPADIPGPVLVVAAGALGVLLVLFRIVDIPAPDIPAVAGDAFDFGREFGIFLGLAASGAIAWGGWQMNMERPGGAAVPVAAPQEQTPVAH